MPEKLRLLILEDDARRTAAMRERLTDRFAQYETRFCTDAERFIATFSEAPDRVLAISLDHDLEPMEPDRRDPGTGRDVANFLAELPPETPRLPILIHSTNRSAVDGMERVLMEAGFPVERVTPYGDLGWISEVWFPAFRKHIIRTAEAPFTSAPMASI